jgi:hypothetical protein
LPWLILKVDCLLSVEEEAEESNKERRSRRG